MMTREPLQRAIRILTSDYFVPMLFKRQKLHLHLKDLAS